MNLVLNDFITAGFSEFNFCLPRRKLFQWRTDLVRYDSGKEQRNEILTQPIRHWYLNWDILDKTARDKYLELFNRARGKHKTFYFKDFDEYQGSITIPTGTSGTYQLNHDYYSGETETWNENKTAIVPDNITIADYTEVPATPGAGEYTLDDDTGIVTFGDTLAGDKACTFEYYFVVRFDFDVLNDVMIHPDLFEGKDIHIVEEIQ